VARSKKSFKDYTAFGTISAELILKNLPFFFFLSFLAIVYIANTHYSEKKVTEIQVIEKELKHLRWEYMALRSANKKNSKQDEVVKKVKELNLSTNYKKPKKIVVKK